MRSIKLVVIFILLLPLYSCFEGLIVNISKKPIAGVQMSFLSESNLEFGREGLPGLIKLAEGLYLYYPNLFYASKLAFLYSAYSFGFFDVSPFDDLDETSEEKKNQMLNFYDRAYKYGILSMDMEIKGFSQAILSRDYTILEKVKLKHMEALYWTTFAWSMKILNNTANPTLISQLDIVEHIINKMVEIQPDYMDGAVYAMYVAYYGGRTQAIGGNPQKTLEYYQKGQKYSEGKSLILDYVFYRYITIQMSDSKEFEKLYKKIKAYKLVDGPNAFINALISKKAQDLFERKKDFF